MKDGYINGFDVSHHNGAVDFGAMAAKSHKFCFLKATEGTTFVDVQFPRSWVEAPKAGLFVGAYHFFHPAMDVKAQTAHFLSTMGLMRKGDLPPVLDWETMDGLRISVAKAQALQWLQIVEQAIGRPPILYSGRAHIESLGDTSAFQRYPLWLAEYAKAPRQPHNWVKPWEFWQYTDQNGMDLNVYKYDLGTLGRMAGG